MGPVVSIKINKQTAKIEGNYTNLTSGVNKTPGKSIPGALFIPKNAFFIFSVRLYPCHLFVMVYRVAWKWIRASGYQP